VGLSFNRLPNSVANSNPLILPAVAVPHSLCLPTASGTGIDRRIAVSRGGRASNQRASDQARGNPCTDITPKTGGIRLASRD
jgi:hypothetical protein